MNEHGLMGDTAYMSGGSDLLGYPCQVLTRIADHPINYIKELLPWNIVASERARTSSAMATSPSVFSIPPAASPSLATGAVTSER
jgi:hypothetical protein